MDEAEKSKYVAARDALSGWFYADHIEWLDLDQITDEDYEALEKSYEVIMETLCKYAGHIVQDDMCMRPDHRHCVMCRTATPNQDVTR